MSTPVDLRRAKPHDAFAVAALHLQLGRELGEVPAPGFLDRWADAWLRDVDRHPAFLAEIVKRPVGLVQLVVVDGLPTLATPAGGRHGTVTTFYVSPTFRRQGIASRLLREVLRWAGSEGLDRLTGDLAGLGSAAPGIARRAGAHPVGSTVVEAALTVPSTLF